MKFSVREVAAMVDHTNLKAYATREDFQKLCDEAREYGFKSVAINTYPVKMCREMLEGSEVLTGAAVGFPLGQMTIEAKAGEAEDAVKNGCQEFDYVLNVGKVKEHDYEYIRREMSVMTAVARKAGICCKVIFETCYLTEEEIIEVAKVAAEVKPDFVKTSTGRSHAGACGAHEEIRRCGRTGQGGRRDPQLGGCQSDDRSRRNPPRHVIRREDRGRNEGSGIRMTRLRHRTADKAEKRGN